MSEKFDKTMGIPEDHIGGHFEWEVVPNCSCGKIKRAVEEQYFFVSNTIIGDYNQFYLMPLAANGSLVHSGGVPILNCPFCGERIKGRKLSSKG